MKHSRSILITGCSSGIGYCAAHALNKRGYHVIASARNIDDVERLRKENLQAVQLDLTDSQSIKNAFAETLEFTRGKLDAVFNNAGITIPGAVEDQSREAMRLVMETNVLGALELTNLCIPVMRNQGYGRIVFNGSILGLIAAKHRGIYSPSKYALEGTCDALRIELAQTGIFVSIIEPGPITSNLRANALAYFDKYVDWRNSIHRDAYEKERNQRLSATAKPTKGTLPPEAVVAKLIHALESHYPKARYSVTTPSHVLRFLKWLLPTPWLDALILRG